MLNESLTIDNISASSLPKEWMGNASIDQDEKVRITIEPYRAVYSSRRKDMDGVRRLGTGPNPAPPAQWSSFFPKTDPTQPKAGFRESLREFRALANLSGLGDVDGIFSGMRDKSPGREVAL